MPTDDYDDDRPVRPRGRGDDDNYVGSPRGSGGAPHRGTMILVFAILGWFCCPIFSIIAVIWGGNDLKEMAAGRMDSSGEGLTKAGRIIGIIHLILFVISLVIWVILFAIGMAAAPAGR